MFEALYVGLMKVLLIFCLIISPVASLLLIFGIIETENILTHIVFHLFTLVDIGLLIWNARYWEKKKTIAIVAAVVLVILAFSMPGIIDFTEKNSAYREALHLVEAGNYNQAYEVLFPYAEYEDHDAYALLRLCEAHIDYDAGDIAGAGRSASAYDYYMPLMLRLEQEEAFVQQVIAEGDVRAAEEAEAERIAEEQEFQRKIRNCVPYVGMGEVYIDSTSLGPHSGEIRHNPEIRHGNRYDANLYDFKRNGKRIYTARCVEGRVIQIWDYRQEYITGTFVFASEKENTDYENPFK